LFESQSKYPIREIEAGITKKFFDDMRCIQWPRRPLAIAAQAVSVY